MRLFSSSKSLKKEKKLRLKDNEDLDRSSSVGVRQTFEHVFLDMECKSYTTYSLTNDTTALQIAKSLQKKY
jgi:hypothetical protein